MKNWVKVLLCAILCVAFIVGLYFLIDKDKSPAPEESSVESTVSEEVSTSEESSLPVESSEVTEESTEISTESSEDTSAVVDPPIESGEVSGAEG